MSDGRNLQGLLESLPDWLAKRLRQPEFLSSPKFRLAQYTVRWLRRIHVNVTGIEPRTKKAMPESEKDAFQSQVLRALRERKRHAYRGPIALRINLETTDRTPALSHHIVKNLLDLLGAPRPAVGTRRRGLLYADDHQVQALSVACQHGSDEPRIRIAATSLRDFLQDLDLARESEDEDDGDFDLEESIENYEYVAKNEQALRNRHGDETYDAWRRTSYRFAQEKFLGRNAMTPGRLALLYGVGHPVLENETAMLEKLFASTPLRIQLSELPQVSGASDLWKTEIEQKIRNFKNRYSWIIDPIVVPVALEVVIKPPPINRTRGKHDLDNVLRTYLLPRIMEILKPVSHFAFTNDWDVLKRTSAASMTRYPFSTPPRSTRIGVTRYEVWRLPQAQEEELGFVSVAMVHDLAGYEDILGKIDDDIERWRDSLDD